MRLKRKVLLFIIGILACVLLAASLVIVRSFQKHYTDALVTGSYGVGYSVESLLYERLALGQPLESLSGMDRKLTEVVEKNPHIDYVYVMDRQGRGVFHSHPELVGRIHDKPKDIKSLNAGKPFWQVVASGDGDRYVEVSLPLFDNDRPLGVIRLGFADSVIDEKVMVAVRQLLAVFLLTFVIIAMVLNLFLRRQVVEPINQLSRFAESIAKGLPYHGNRLDRSDEIGLLHGALERMSATLTQRIEALRSGGQLLEEKVGARTRQLAQINNNLEASNRNLKQALHRERELTDALRHSEERFRMLFESNRAVMLIIDPQDGQVVAANKAALAYYGYSRERLLQLRISDINRLSSEEISREMKRAQKQERNHFYFRHALASGEIRDVEVHSGPISWDDRSLLYSIIHDVTDRKRAEAELKYIAHYDALTGLPNRLLKADRLRQAIIQCRRNETSVAVCYLDLDGFKPINDSYGHDIGDLILIETAHRLLNMVREGDTVSRIGGDEFVLILANLSGLEQCRLILDRVLTAISQPIAIDEQAVEVCASIGLTLYPEDEVDADILLRHADQAMYVAKANGKNRYHVFDPVEDRQMRAHKEQLLSLEKALAEHKFELHFQPKVNMLTGGVVGMEALIRWNHPEKGLLLPDEFLWYMDNTDLEIELGYWVIRQALEAQRSLREAGLDLPVSVNITAHHLQHAGFIERIGSILQALPLRKSGDMEFEILESASIEDMTDIFHTLVGCRDLGIHFALDDFGTGYSSLAYFHRLPVDSLKIDKTFIQGMLEDPQDLAIVDSVVRLAGAFKHPVIAEGVESLEHGAALLRLGCHLGQGYGIAEPMPLGELLAWKQRWERNPEWQNLKHRLLREDGIDIQAAIASQREWVEGLLVMLRERRSSVSVQLDGRHCAFSRWFHGVGYLHYGHLPLYEQISTQHERVHALGQELYSLASHGFRQEAEARTHELEAMRDRFVELIERLRDTPVEGIESQGGVSAG